MSTCAAGFRQGIAGAVGDRHRIDPLCLFFLLQNLSRRRIEIVAGRCFHFQKIILFSQQVRPIQLPVLGGRLNRSEIPGLVVVLHGQSYVKTRVLRRNSGELVRFIRAVQGKHRAGKRLMRSVLLCQVNAPEQVRVFAGDDLRLCRCVRQGIGAGCRVEETLKGVALTAGQFHNRVRLSFRPCPFIRLQTYRFRQAFSRFDSDRKFLVWRIAQCGDDFFSGGIFTGRCRTGVNQKAEYFLLPS